MGMIYKRGAVWWVKYYRNGRSMRESTGSAKESDATSLLKNALSVAVEACTRRVESMMSA